MQLYPNVGKSIFGWSCCRAAVVIFAQSTVFLGTNGQYLPALVRDNGQKWRIVNAASTESFWALSEVEFHGATTCNDLRRDGAPFASSFVLASESGAHAPNLAFDRKAPRELDNAWWADCGENGCSAMSEHIGMDYPMRTHDMKCVRVLQAGGLNHHATSIELERWDGRAWVREQTFRETYGGFFVNLPVAALTKWKITPLTAVSGTWRIEEVAMYSDIECRTFVGGVSAAFGEVGNGTFPDDVENPSRNAFDGKVETSWTATCENDCDAEKPWVELNVQSPGEMRCIRFIQAGGYGVQAVLVQAWDGGAYQDRSTFAGLNSGSWDYLARWDVADRQYGSLWRFVPEEMVRKRWKVYEIELHSNWGCSAPIEIITSIGAGCFGETTPNAATDGDVLTYVLSPTEGSVSGTEWQGRYDSAGGKHHVLGTPWIGAATQAGVAVRCVRFLQGESWEESTADFAVQVWNSTAWVDYTDKHDMNGPTVDIDLRFRQLTNDNTRRGPPTWLRLPAVDQAMWRIAQLDVIFEHLAVKEVHFYQSIDCAGEVRGVPLASSEDPAHANNPPRQAFDHEYSTEWWSHCSVCALAEAWIGVHPPEPVSVRCVKLFQTSKPPNDRGVPWWTTGVNLDKWNGHQWVTLSEFHGLSRGAWDWLHLYAHMPTAFDISTKFGSWGIIENTAWRITHTDPLFRRWAIASLGFYSDGDCQDNVGDVAIGSGEVIDFEMAAAFDESVLTEWLSSCESCDPGQAWLGVFSPIPVNVKCIRVLQSRRQFSGSRGLSVESWDGTLWNQVLHIADMEPTALAQLVPRQSASIESVRLKWRLVNSGVVRKSWRVAGIKFFTGTACQDHASGVIIESGHVIGNGPEIAFNLSDPGKQNDGEFWESSCYDCEPGEAWIGLSLEPDAPPIRCVQFRQTRDPAHGAETVSVDVLTDHGWEVALSFEHANLDAWDHLHLTKVPDSIADRFTSSALRVEARTLWRVVNAAPVTRTWIVYYVRFFARIADGVCEDPLEGIPMASGESDGYPPMLASSTGSGGWHASCIECVTTAGWIGIRLPEPTDVQCVEFSQSSSSFDTSSAVTLEFWGGFSWSVAHTFDGLSGGSTLTLSKAWQYPVDLQRFRIVALDEMSDNWRLAELKFFAGVECTFEVKGLPVVSSVDRGNMARFALDGNETTFWEVGGIPPFPNSSLWFGVHFANPQDVKCVVVRQTDDTGRWSGAIALERYWNTSWDRISVLDHFRAGGSFVFNAFTAAAQDLFINFQDPETQPPVWYLSDVGFLFGHRTNSTSKYKYGWNCELNGIRREYHNDPLFDTAIEVTCPGAIWEIVVLAGRYYTRVTYSNPGVGVDTIGCTLENKNASAGVLGSYEKITTEVIANVADAVLTFNASTRCNSISTLEVFSLPRPLTMWRIVNNASVGGRWRIVEVEFHSTDTCSNNAISARKPLMFSSCYSHGTSVTDSVDGNMSTSWVSGCNGCRPGDAWIAAAFTSLQVVACVKLHQAVEYDSMVGAVVLERWNKNAWELFEMFGDLAGGVWGRYNNRWVEPLFGNRWRLVMGNATLPTENLYVAETAFYGDAACTYKLPGFAISSASQASSPNLLAFDGFSKTQWVSECDTCQNGQAPSTDEGMPWIGMHFDDPVDVFCAAAILGESGDVQTKVTERELRVPMHLERWNGRFWSSLGIAVSARAGAWAYAHRLLDMGEGLVAGQAWRLSNGASTSAPWKVQESRYYTSPECSEGKLYGWPIASSSNLFLKAIFAFDDDKNYNSAWEAGCAEGSCKKMTEWIGSVFNRTEDVRCIEIYQASQTMKGNPASPSIAVERWNPEVGWELVEIFGRIYSLKSGRWEMLKLPVRKEVSLY